MKIDYRQGLISADSGFLQLSKDAPKCIDIVIDKSPVIASVAFGDKDYLISEKVSVKSAWGPIENRLTNYLYWDMDAHTGKITYGSTLLPVFKSLTAPEYPRNDQMWWSLSDNKMYVYRDDKWDAVLRVFAGKIKQNKIIVEEALESQVGILIPTTAGYILSTENGPARDNSGNFLTTDSYIELSSGTTDIKDSSISFIAGEDIDKLSIVSIDGGYAKKQNDTIPFGIVSKDAVKDSPVTVLTGGSIVTSSGWKWENADIGKPIYSDSKGQLTLIKPSENNYVKVGTIISTESILLQFQDGIEVAAEFKKLEEFNTVQEKLVNDAIANCASNIDTLDTLVKEIDNKLDHKSNDDHSHSANEITGLQIQLDKKADAEHSHEEIYALGQSFKNEIDKKVNVSQYSKQIVPLAESIKEIESSLKSKADIYHSHNIHEVANLQAALDKKADTVHSHEEIDALNESIKAQLATKADVVHSHEEIDALNESIKQIDDSLNGKASVYHSHNIYEIADLQEQLDKKSDINHSHEEIDLINESINEIDDSLKSKASINHSHTIDNIIDLQQGLDTKANIIHTHTIEDISQLNEMLQSKANVNHHHSLASLSDVNSANISDGQYLRYSAALNSWETAPIISLVTYKSLPLYKIELSDAGNKLTFGSESESVVQLPNNAPIGFTVKCIQLENAKLTFQPDAGATLGNINGHTKSAGKFAVVDLTVVSNANGTNAIYVMTGDTAL